MHTPTSSNRTLTQRVAMLLAGTLLLANAWGQTPPVQSQPDKTAAAIQHLENGSFTELDISQVMNAKAAQAAPALQKQFAETKDADVKDRLAAAMVRLGADPEGTYWHYLIQQAIPALHSDAPYPESFSPEGKTLPEPSPDFLVWADAHHLSPDAAADEQITTLPDRILALATSQDRRIIPLLRHALLSPNYLIEANAALGLAQMQDKRSIDLIVYICERAPADMRTVLAVYLVYFDDPRAQSTAEAYVPSEFLHSLRESIAAGRTRPLDP